MAFFDRFKGGNKTKEAKTEPKLKKPAVSLKQDEKTTEKPVAQKIAPQPDSIAYRVLVRPIVSEKTARLEKEHQYAFVVAARANKVEIKKAVEKHYRVHVTNVNIVTFSASTSARVARSESAAIGARLM